MKDRGDETPETHARESSSLHFKRSLKCFSVFRIHVSADKILSTKLFSVRNYCPCKSESK